MNVYFSFLPFLQTSTRVKIGIRMRIVDRNLTMYDPYLQDKVYRLYLYTGR